MKWTTIILALYVFGLSVWPCADEAVPMTRQERGAVLIAASVPLPSPAHDNHDACTPFCTCTCCAATISIAPHVNYSVVPTVELVPIATAIFQYVPVHWASPLSAIWQPPQLRGLNTLAFRVGYYCYVLLGGSSTAYTRPAFFYFSFVQTDHAGSHHPFFHSE